MPTLTINGNIRTDTEANWTADATVYSAKTILVSTDVQYTGTDQNKFKLADGTNTWANLDYFADTATATREGIVELATQTEVNTGTDTGRVVTPDTLEDKTYGTFSGATISDNATLKTALQELETAVEAGANDEVFHYFNLSNLTPTDSTTYYMGQQTSMSTSTIAFARIPIRAGTVNRVDINLYVASTLGSGESITVKLVTNNGSQVDTISTDLTADDAGRNNYQSKTGLGLTVVDGLSWIQIETPAWVTNPVAVQFRVEVHVEV